MKSLFLCVILILCGCLLWGCGGKGGHNTTVQILNKQTTIPAGSQFVFNAQTMHNHGSPPGISWSLTPASGEGTLTNVVNNGSAGSVTYNAPAATCANCVTITAAVVGDASSTDFDTFSIAGAGVVISTASLPGGNMPNGTQGVPYGWTLQAIGGTAPYTWSIASGTLPAWASLNASSGAITGTPNATGTSPQFSVQVKDSASPPSTSPAVQLSITINAELSTNDAQLNGQYAFEISSFGTVAGDQHAEVGSFTADGKGNITAGVVDINGPGGAQTVTITNGNYGVGADNRGIANLNYSTGTTRTIAFALGALNGSLVATAGSLIEFDYTTATPGQVGSGAMYLQDSTAFGLSSITGPYAFQLIGQSTFAPSRVVEMGAATADGAGNLNPGELDENTTGTMTNSAFTASLTIDPTYTFTNGRLIFKFATGTTGNAVLYIVSSSQALMMTTDMESSSGLLIGNVSSQSSSSFTNSSLNGNAVFYLEGQGQTASDSFSALGLITLDGAGNITLVSRDKNDSGVHSKTTNQTGITYSVQSNGRVTSTGGSNPAIIYLVSSSEGFMMEENSSVTAGIVVMQSGGPFSGVSISGNYFFGVSPPAVPASAVTSGIATSTGNGTVNLTVDSSSVLGLSEGQVIAASGLTIAANGVGADSSSDVIYMVSPNLAFFLNTTVSAPEIVIIEK
jgi:large repetitive protein